MGYLFVWIPPIRYCSLIIYFNDVHSFRCLYGTSWIPSQFRLEVRKNESYETNINISLFSFTKLIFSILINMCHQSNVITYFCDCFNDTRFTSLVKMSLDVLISKILLLLVMVSSLHNQFFSYYKYPPSP